MAIVSLTTPIRSFFSKTGNYCLDNSFYFTTCFNLALNTNLLAAKIFPSLPTQVTVWSRALKSFTGAIYLKGCMNELRRDVTVISSFYDKRNLSGMFLTACKITSQVIDIVLISGGVVVSIASLTGRTQWRDKFYQSMQPYTITSVALSIFLLFANLIITRALKNHRITTDADVWKQSLLSSWDVKNLEQSPGSKQEKESEENEQIDRNFTWSIISLIAPPLFYLAHQSLNRLKPDSTLSAGLNWSVSAFSILSLNYRKTGTPFSSSK